LTIIPIALRQPEALGSTACAEAGDAIAALRLMAPSTSSASLVGVVIGVVRIVLGMSVSPVGRKRRWLVVASNNARFKAWMKSAARHVNRIRLWCSA
jgi:hypothetical protein